MAHYGIGALVAVTILAELGDCRRFSSSGRRSATPGWTSPSTSPISTARPGTCRRQGPPALRWALYEAAQAARRQGSARTATTTCRQPSGSAATAPACRSRASCSSAATTRCASSARRHSRHPTDERRIAEPRAARQAAVLEGPSVQRPASRQMLWPLDPGFGSAVQQRVPARRPAHQTMSFPPNNRWRAPSPHSHRCAAAGSRQLLLPTTLAWTASKDRAAATLPPAGSPHQTSCRRPRSQPEGRGPK